MGSLVAMFFACSGRRRILAGFVGGLVTVLVVAQLWLLPVAIGDPYFFEAQLRLAVIASLPVLTFAFLGAFVRKKIAV
ncbi:hypothetical protein FPZ24_01770 [Sphingomonas panacisoli]|uniref:Uncharacterized protein n=1 Tax=Sphingomonas panacisoli TaxID=1813879 RepID=A0A5B8LE58_9SPHN|nr:hypothetical protein [Sphingomonas panacisoli]QDZ06353.1 hypothetical protein FPZ24_01770 [Sphingomonas panacisoli]